MPGIILGYRGSNRPIVKCQISVDASFPQDATGTPVITVNALIDTGATHVVVTPRLIKFLALMQTGTTNNTVVGGLTKVCPTYTGSIILTGNQYLDPSRPFALTIHGATIIGDELEGCDAILGWDVLSGVDMAFSRDRTFAIQLPG